MDFSPPIKPPRGVKQPKETSGLLMSVIRTLSASETNEQREREKAKLEAEYKICDAKLDKLVSRHEGDLTEVMRLFSTLSKQVSESREKIHRVKENLKDCKSKLHCRRDELQKLWMEGIKYKHMLQLLDEIQKLTDAPNQLSKYLNKKHYLHATELLVEAVSLGQTNLDGIEGIKELRIELEQKKEQLHLQLLHELKQHMYMKTSQHVLILKRQGSNRDGVSNGPLQRTTEGRLSARQSRKTVLELPEKFEVSPKTFVVEEDITKSDPEQDSTHFMAIIIKSLSLLDKLPLAIQEIESSIQPSLVSIINRTTLNICDYQALTNTTHITTTNPNMMYGNPFSTTSSLLFSSNSNKQRQSAAAAAALVDLLQTLFEQIRQIANAHNIVLAYLRRAANSQIIGEGGKVFGMEVYWNQVQSVLQNILNEYLDIQNLNSSSTQVNEALVTNTNNVSSYFSRRKPQPKKKNLFKFGSSANTSGNSSAYKEGGTSLTLQRREKNVVCPADPNNILHIFVPLMCFVEEIEQTMELKQGVQCSLHQFLSAYVSDTYLTRKHLEILHKIDAVVRSPDAWKTTVLLDITTDYKPLLESTVNVEKYIRVWRDVLVSLPFYGELIVKYACNALKEYRDTCNNAYQGIVQPHSEDKRIYSAAWLKDEDISRFLKSLPNWLSLKSQQEFLARNERRRPTQLRREHTMEEESPEDVRQRNRKEAEILASNLGEGGVGAGEILSDMGLLKELAQLQESMEWFSVRMLQFASEFRKEPTSSPLISIGSTPAIPPGVLHNLTSTAQEFDELANTCLLLLHLEVRVQSFHYLLTQSEYNKESQEPDPKVLELSRVLSNIDEVMTSSLHSRKCKYIFEGLGHLIAKILISSSQYMQSIDEVGIQRMCRNVFALQQTLTNITMTREVALDHARHYFELFFLTPEEILNGIVEKGPQFSELEYMNAFQLLHRSKKSADKSSVTVHLERLSDILGEVGVTV